MKPRTLALVFELGAAGVEVAFGGEGLHGDVTLRNSGTGTTADVGQSAVDTENLAGDPAVIGIQ